MLNFWWNIRKNTKALYARRFHIRDLADHYLEWRSAKKHFYYLYMFLCTIWYRLHISVWRRSSIQSQVVKSGSLQTSEVGAKLTFKNLALVVTREPPYERAKKSSRNGAKGPDALVEARKNQVSSIASWNERSPTLLARIVWRGRCKQPLKGWATPRVRATWWFLMTNCREMSLRGDKLRRIKFRCSRSKLVGCIIDWR